MNIGQNICLNDILDKFENASHKLGEILKQEGHDGLDCSPESHSPHTNSASLFLKRILHLCSFGSNL